MLGLADWQLDGKTIDDALGFNRVPHYSRTVWDV